MATFQTPDQGLVLIPLCLKVSLYLNPLASLICQGTVTSSLSPSSAARLPSSSTFLAMTPLALPGQPVALLHRHGHQALDFIAPARSSAGPVFPWSP